MSPRFLSLRLRLLAIRARNALRELKHVNREEPMIAHSIPKISAITALGVALSFGTAMSQTKSLKDQLVGTWTVVSWEQMNKDGSKTQRFGANPKGVNSFDANGHFFMMFARPDLPKFASNDPTNPTPDEAKAITVGSVAYFGTYTVDEPSKTISLKIEASSLPNQLGIDQKRVITSLTADELKYTNTTAVGGAGQINTVYKRAQ
jgi:hypothetical protein